ncbi:unnamed protein product [Rotaria sp. Silwood1]|nr:unnamed protein product [Rotaria sp. Silwood1]
MNRSKQGGNQGNDVENGETGLHLKLKTRHLKMIAIGGSIGTSLFVASGSAVATGDPAALVLDFAIAGFMLFNVCIALGELAVTFPVSGSFAVYSSHFLDPTWGFAMELCEGTKQSSKLPYESLLLLHLLPLLLVNIDLPNNLINKMVLGFPVSM